MLLRLKHYGTTAGYRSSENRGIGYGKFSLSSWPLGVQVEQPSERPSACTGAEACIGAEAVA